ncbi:HtaA domain-containing protein [Patulibacter defluvii]|uniref:HtaA domain-containing protein n=1 Tax=Patulibacter defluvii TaxID=3095358 RepID=UPI002A756639|nr:HtaA domain-containing protein [Patulibacter sp. DM4]
MPHRHRPRRPFARGFAPAATVATLAFALVVPGVASAASTAPSVIGGGTTTISFSPAGKRNLRRAGITVRALPTATTLSTGQLKLPVSRGLMRPKSLTAKVDHLGGGIEFRRGDRVLTMTELRITIGKRTIRGSAVLEGRRTSLFRVLLKGARIRATKRSLIVERVQMRVAYALLQATRKYLRTSKLQRGSLGTIKLEATVAPSTKAQLTFGGGATTLTFNDGVEGGLAQKGVTVTPQGPATTTGRGAYAFPITSGAINKTTFRGLFQHSGGLTFAAGSTAFTLEDLEIVLDGSQPHVNARVATDRFAVFNLNLRRIKGAVEGNPVRIEGAVATLTSNAASALNKVLGTTTITKGTPIGRFDIVAVRR